MYFGAPDINGVKDAGSDLTCRPIPS